MIRQSDINRIIAEYEKLCAYDGKCGRAFLKGVTLVAERRISYDARTGRWITAYPNGKEHEGRPLFIGENGRVLAGLGKANGKKLSELHKPETHQPLAWRGSSQRRNTKEDYEEREYWINEKRQKSKKELKREQKKAQKLEHQSEQAAQKLQAQPLSPAQKQAEVTRQRFLNTPLPDHFESSGQAVDYFKQVAPHVTADDLAAMSPYAAHAVATAVKMFGNDFPEFFDHGLSFRHIAVAEAELSTAIANQLSEKELRAKLQEKANARFVAIFNDRDYVAAKVSSLVSAANLESNQQRFALLRSLQKLLEANGLDPKSITISQMATNPQLVDAIKSVWIDYALDGCVKAAKQEQEAEITLKRQALQSIAEFKTRAFALFDQHSNSVWLLSPSFVNKFAPCQSQQQIASLYASHLDADSSIRFHPELRNDISPLTAVVIHEMAHGLDIFTSRRGTPFEHRHGGCSCSPEMLSLFAEEQRKFLVQHPWAQEELRRYDSANKDPRSIHEDVRPPDVPYALYDQFEFMAEMLTEAFTAPNPSDASKKVLSIVKAIFHNSISI